MLLMMLIMSLPLLGVALFFVLPLGEALPTYVAVAGFSVLYQCLMMGAMRLPVRMGKEKMTGSVVVVRRWEGRWGQVVHDGEIWKAETKEKQAFAPGEKVSITEVDCLTVRVEPLARDHPNAVARSWLHRPRQATK